MGVETREKWGGEGQGKRGSYSGDRWSGVVEKDQGKKWGLMEKKGQHTSLFHTIHFFHYLLPHLL